MKFLISAVVFCGLLMFVSPNAYSCSCNTPSPQQAFENSVAVFVGEFSGFVFKGKRQPARIRFKVERQWKGELPSEVVLNYGDIPRRCGDLSYVKGKKHLIYVTLLDGELFVRVDCTRSREVRYATEDLEYPDKLQTQADVKRR